VKIEAAWLKELRETLAFRPVWSFVLLAAAVPLLLPRTVMDWLGLTHLRDQVRDRTWVARRSLRSSAWWQVRFALPVLTSLLRTGSAEGRPAATR